jgi:hypothetical protein
MPLSLPCLGSISARYWNGDFRTLRAPYTPGVGVLPLDVAGCRAMSLLHHARRSGDLLARSVAGWLRAAWAWSVAGVVAGLLVAACGSPPPPKGLSGLKPLAHDASPVEVVRYALRALAYSSFDETNQNHVIFETSDLPAPEAAAIRAKAGNGQTQLFRAEVTDLANFVIVERLQGKMIHLKASQGVYSISLGGSRYKRLPASEANPLFDKLESDLAAAGDVVLSARRLGPAVVDGINVVRYSAKLSVKTIRKQAVSLMSLVGTNIGGSLTITADPEIADVNPATGFPVRLVVTVHDSINLAKEHKKGLSGILTVVDTGTQTYSRVHSR